MCWPSVGGARAVVAVRPGGDAKRPARIAVRPGDRMLELFVVSARVELGADEIRVIHLLAGDHLLGRNTLCPKGFHDRSRLLRSGPGSDQLVEHVVVERARRRAPTAPPRIRRRQSDTPPAGSRAGGCLPVAGRHRSSNTRSPVRRSRTRRPRSGRPRSVAPPRCGAGARVRPAARHRRAHRRRDRRAPADCTAARRHSRSPPTSPRSARSSTPSRRSRARGRRRPKPGIRTTMTSGFSATSES